MALQRSCALLIVLMASCHSRASSDVESRRLMMDCIDPSTGKQTQEKAEGKHLGGGKRCDLVTIAQHTVTKRASMKKRNVFKSARDFYDLETRIYERLQSVTRPRGCEKFILFPRMLSKNDTTLSFISERFGAPMECNHLDMCCKDMCHLLPLRGPTGFCRQITDIMSKNILFGVARGRLSSNIGSVKAGKAKLLEARMNGRSHGGGQVVLYDFDQAQIDGYPAKYGNAEEPLGKVLRDISHSASVGYDQCYNASRDSQELDDQDGTESSVNRTNSSRRDPLYGMDDDTFGCRFEEELRTMVQVESMTMKHVKSLRNWDTLRTPRKHVEVAVTDSPQRAEKHRGANC